MKPRGIISFAVLIILIVLFFFYIKANISDFLTLKLANPLLIILLLALFLISYITISIVTKSLLNPLGISLKNKEAFALSIITGFYNLITPFKGGLAARAVYLKKKYKFPYTDFLATLSASYILIFLVASFLGLISTALIFYLTANFNIIIFLIFLALFLLLSFIVLFSPKFPLTSSSFINRFINVLNGWHLIKNNKKVIAITVILSIIQLLLSAFMLSLQFNVFGVEVSFIKSLFLASLSSLGLIIGLTPAGLGIQEAILVFSAHTIGITTTQSLSAALLGRAISFLVLFTLGPLFSYLLIKKEKQEIKRDNMPKSREVSNHVFIYLFIAYTILILLISLGIISKYTLHFEIFAIILAIAGIFYFNSSKKINKPLHNVLLIISVLFILLMRIIPYINNPIPLGYDTGLYKYALEHIGNEDLWMLQSMEPGFLYLMAPFTLIFSSAFILKALFIFSILILGIAIYSFSKAYFNKTTAILSLLIYSLSVIQFITFTFLYYKNILGLTLMLFSLTLLKNYEITNKKHALYLFIVLAGLLGSIHRPTFYMFGLSYFFYALIVPYKNKRYALKKLGIYTISGVIILIIASLFYLGKFRQAIITVLPWVAHSFISPGESPGTFVSFFEYQFLTLAYLPLAILGFFYLIKEKKINILFLWALINAIIVYFQFFFFNRFIIHLDITLIILAAYSTSHLLNKKIIPLLIILFISSGIITSQIALEAKPLISQETLSLMENLPVEENATIISSSSEFSPWLLAYSNRKIIAPGLFDNSLNKEEQAALFSEDKEKTEIMLSRYQKPIYLFSQKTINNPCFSKYKEENNIYSYKC